MARSKQSRRAPDDRPDAASALEAALDDLDALHISVVRLGDASELAPDNDLTTEDGDDLPASRFAVGDEESGPPRGGGLVFDTRLTLSLDAEQAESLLFQLARVTRGESSREVEVSLDGRFVLGADAAADVRAALREGSKR